MMLRAHRKNAPAPAAGVKPQSSASSAPPSSSSQLQMKFKAHDRCHIHPQMRHTNAQCRNQQHDKSKQSQAREQIPGSAPTHADKASDTKSPAETPQTAASAPKFPHITCHKCKMKGHYANSCPVPRDSQPSADQKSNEQGKKSTPAIAHLNTNFSPSFSTHLVYLNKALPESGSET